MENCREETLIIMIKLLNVQMGLLKMEKKLVKSDCKENGAKNIRLKTQ
jgi:hypothetical protein